MNRLKVETEDRKERDLQMKWTVLSSEYLHKEEWLTIRKDKCKLTNGTIIPAFYVNEYADWVNVFAVTDEGCVLMVKQYRHGVAQVGIELPGGVIDQGETPEQAARREVLEETGYAFETYTYLGKVCANPATTNNFLHMFLAENGKKVAEQKLDETEEVELLLYTIEDVKKLVKENKIVQSLHVNNIFYALNKIGEMDY